MMSLKKWALRMMRVNAKAKAIKDKNHVHRGKKQLQAPKRAPEVAACPEGNER